MEPDVTLRTIDARVHGRYLLQVPRQPPPWPALFSFHGYGEDASANLEAIRRVPDAAGWLLVAVQALHPFYTRDQRVVSSWMTRQDRELAIEDNLTYVARVVDAVRSEYPIDERRLAFAGFSQGGAMAYRAAAHLPAAGVIVLAADVPPDVHEAQLPPVLIGRGTADSWYTEDKMAADLERLRGSNVSVDTCVFDGGHEWSDAFLAAAGRFLARIVSEQSPG